MHDNHEHEHVHTHEHSHDGNAHSHEHSHSHSHEHESHSHFHDVIHNEGAEHNHSHSEEKETFALLKYMLSHNRQHAGELRELLARLENLDKAEAASELKKAVSCFDAGNEALEKVISHLNL